jgi:hypothetical protein
MALETTVPRALDRCLASCERWAGRRPAPPGEFGEALALVANLLWVHRFDTIEDRGPS